jgi:DNA-binding NtrC family response regulator
MRGHGGYAEIEAGRIALMLPLAVPSLAVSVRPRVLISAADGDWVLAITSALRSSGIDVATCSSSAAAEGLLSAGCRYSAVLFDVDEAHSAAAIAQRLRAADPHVHCICVTPNLRVQALRDLMSAGALGYCPRWLSPTIVSSWLCPMLGLPR